MSNLLTDVEDIYLLREGDLVSKTDRFRLFTGSQVGNSPQKGINWLGAFPMLECVMIQCTVGSGYTDKWMGHCGTLFIYSLMVSNRGKQNAKVNLASKENRSLLEQPEHKAPILLMTEGERNHLVVEGWFEVLTEYHANPAHPSVDSVLLKKISSHYPY